ncbi:MAG: nucleotidyltransferase domain-containing protein [Fimbriimonadaceae bacterium]|nr:nucleotidyltransferase domain-containing protein [Fimbriimonadaceae bacterium]
MVSFDPEATGALDAVCRKYAVHRLKLFGSAIEDNFDPASSDLDFLVEFDEPPPGMRLGTQFFGLLEELQGIFQRPIDLLEESAIENSRLRRSTSKGAVTLFAA